eukprot:maker-scaffold149_size310270-snap-gene-2.20 protein:Tk01270 transcript:maker-scaffold149_size310270-snap-gene-2.20-mRNA-1 annotation:"hypothetical protein TcasGA2_TC012802"
MPPKKRPIKSVDEPQESKSKRAKLDKPKKCPIKSIDEPPEPKSKRPKLDKPKGSKSPQPWKWTPEEIIAKEFCHGDLDCSTNICKMLSEGSSIPYLARYERDTTGDKTADELRQIEERQDYLLSVMAKAQIVLQKVATAEPKLPDENIIKQKIYSVKTLEEVEDLSAPFKKGSKKALFAQAEEMGLRPLADDIFEGKPFRMESYVNPEEAAISDLESVEKQVVFILAHLIAKSDQVLAIVASLEQDPDIYITANKARETKTALAKKAAARVDESKYDSYIGFAQRLKIIKPHQVLALNRGEILKVLSVKVVISEKLEVRFTQFCRHHFRANQSSKRTQIINKAIKDCFDRFLSPLMCRRIRTRLNHEAETQSIEVFCQNLRNLLLTPPCHRTVILGLDPGYKNCKYAVIGKEGSILSTGVLPVRFWSDQPLKSSDQELLINEVIDNKVEVLAIGNGTACRETESLVSGLIKNNAFSPQEVKYTIVNEQGASIYSCSDAAKEEHPDLDPLVISAASIARRVQDPLSEYVKIEPKHLGVGMYQHDVSETKLKKNLNDIMMECVSFLGVDVNLAPLHVLQKVAGLNMKTAMAIIKQRSKKAILSRDELKSISGIGEKTFQQCAGFVRIFPRKNQRVTLDSYLIHPDMYDLAIQIMSEHKVKEAQLGKTEFCTYFKTILNSVSMESQAMRLIIEAFSQPIQYDIRESMDKPCFKTEVMSVNDIREGMKLTGVVGNVTHFGAFVDIGVGQNGLIHQSRMIGQTLKLGQQVEVTVTDIKLERKRIGLSLVA